MNLSKHEDKMLKLQHQLRENQRELQDFMSDLGNWEEEIKAKEESLKKKKTNEPEVLPPVRNSLDKKKLKKKKKKNEQSKKPPKISGSDFRAWDKFDVDKALKEIDEAEDKESSSEYETDEEWENEKRKHLANEEKNKGNSHLSAGAYEVAVECYTRGIELDPTNILLPANRAMAFLKLQQYGAAEVDCTTAIMLDPLYVKAYLRRAAARVGLQHLPEALSDYNRALQLEPTNKQAKSEIERIEKELSRDLDQRPTVSALENSHKNVVKPVFKPPEERSKKPLKRIEIQEIGVEENTRQREAIAKVQAAQSTAKKELEAKDQQMFQQFTERPLPLEGGSESQPLNATKCSDPPLQLQSISNIQPTDMQSVPENSLMDTEIVFDSKHTSIVSISNSIESKITTQKDSSAQSPLPQVSEGGIMSIKTILAREPPHSSFQFQADFKVLKNDLHAFYLYFRRIDPGLYPKLFGQSLEAVIVLHIVEAIKKYFIPANEEFYHQLKSLSEVKRFSMTVMFLSSKEKQGIKEIFEYLKQQGVYSQTDIETLAQKYEV